MARNLRFIAIWLCFSAIGSVGFSFLLPLIVSHDGEQQMIDAPGVIYRGVCCIEAPWHFFQHLIWFPIAPLLLLLAAISAILSALFTTSNQAD
ncbi:hypothetical protein [Asticcacaulis taihuensis]|uniref:hypothetical protein n=1 Tax=Asticcacaulis taihuensis TaxID=260084 RepID=UPI00111420E8|nr:hypothetical protein [Asticcacaulis taihuensis]